MTEIGDGDRRGARGEVADVWDAGSLHYAVRRFRLHGCGRDDGERKVGLPELIIGCR